MKILAVDDERISLMFLEDRFQKYGIDVRTAMDGFSALVVLEDYQPDLILLDNVMPKMSGRELAEKLKADERYKDIPIIMFSAVADADEREAAFEAGVADYILKPANFSEILQRISKVMEPK